MEKRHIAKKRLWLTVRIIQIRKAGSYQVQNTITDRVSTSVCFVLFMPEDYLTAKTLSVHYHMDSMHISCFSNLMNINPKRTNSVLPHQRDSRAVETTVLLVGAEEEAEQCFPHRVSPYHLRSGSTFSLSIEIGISDTNLVQERGLVTSWEPKISFVPKKQRVLGFSRSLDGKMVEQTHQARHAHVIRLAPTRIRYYPWMSMAWRLTCRRSSSWARPSYIDRGPWEWPLSRTRSTDSQTLRQVESVRGKREVIRKDWWPWL